VLHSYAAATASVLGGTPGEVVVGEKTVAATAAAESAVTEKGLCEGARRRQLSYARIRR